MEGRPEPMDGAAEKVYVAVTREVKESEQLLRWALQQFAGVVATIVITHVHLPPKSLPMHGFRLNRSKIREQELASFRNAQWHAMSKSMEIYVQLCVRAKVPAEKLVVESDNVTEALVDLVSQHHITTLVMGTSDKHYSWKLKKPRSTKASIVEKKAEAFCNIWFVCKGKLISKRFDAIQSMSQRWASLTSIPGGETAGSNHSLDRSRADLSRHMSQPEAVILTPMKRPSIARSYTVMPSSTLKEDTSESDNGDEQEQVIQDSESLSQQRVFEELEEARQKIDQTSLKLARAMTDAEELARQKDELIMKYEEERDHLMAQRDTAMREAEELRRKNSTLQDYTVNGHVQITEFSEAEITEATRNFDDSLKLGEGAFGATVYKGYLRHTPVVIKRLNRTGMRVEFTQEVEVLSTVRHPNLITLIGVCYDAEALVYEYLPNGNLEDRLMCKDRTKPLPWQLRIRILADVCSALIFLHSHRPSSIIHNDLKPSNVLLDANYVCKLGGFGVRRLMDDKKTTTLFRHTHPKGTVIYMDPEYVITGELTQTSDVYSFGVLIFRVLTGRSGLGMVKEMQRALEKGSFRDILDVSAGGWPVEKAEKLAHVALKCCEIRGRNRPRLDGEVWSAIQPMIPPMTAVSSSSLQLPVFPVKLLPEDLTGVPSYFICPILQEVMRDPVIAADGFTYEARAIKEWFDGGHHTSPMTNLQLPHCDLVPNHAIRSAIQEWLQKKE